MGVSIHKKGQARPKPARPPKAPKRTPAQEREEALELLGVTEYELAAVPKVEPLLREARVYDKLWDYLTLGREYGAAKLLLEKYHQLKFIGLHKAVPFEAYCLSAKVVTLDALSVLSKVMKSHVDLLTNSKKLAGLHDSGLGSAPGEADVAALPPIEDEIRTLSDRFNEQMLASVAAAAPADDDDDDDEEGED